MRDYFTDIISAGCIILSAINDALTTLSENGKVVPWGLSNS